MPNLCQRWAAPGPARHTGSCDRLLLGGIVVGRAALVLDLIKALPSRREHGGPAGVALPPAHPDVHVFWLKLHDSGATAGLLRGDDRGDGLPERVQDDALALGHVL